MHKAHQQFVKPEKARACIKRVLRAPRSKRKRKSNHSQSHVEPQRKRHCSDELHQAARRALDCASDQQLQECLHVLGMTHARSMWPHQQEGVHFLLQNRGALLADEPGTGKTLQALCAVAVLARITRRPALVVTPKGVVDTWMTELQNSFPTPGGLLAISVKEFDIEQPTPESIAAHDVVVISHSTMTGQWVDNLRSLRTLRETDSAFTYAGIAFDECGFPSVCDSVCDGSYHPLFTTSWCVVVVDESHNMRNRDSDLFGAVMALRATHLRLAMTGTPKINTDEDMDAQRAFCNYGDMSSERTLHVRAITKAAMSAHVNERRTVDDEGNEIFQEGFEGVPAAILQRHDVEMTPALRALIEEIRASGQCSVDLLERQVAESLEDPSPALRKACSAKLLRAARAVEHPKLALIRTIVNEAKARDERTVVFCYHKGTAVGYAQHFGGLCLTGDASDDRTFVLRRFASRRGPKVLCCTHCIREGINLTAASNVVFASIWWQPGEEKQCANRVHRSGQKRRVTVHKIILRGSVEEHVKCISDSKAGLGNLEHLS